jgi:hypothetical protein
VAVNFISMRRVIRLLMPNESGAGKRVVEAVQAADGKVERSRIKLLARETSLKEIVVSCDTEKELLGVLSSLESLDGVSVVGVEHVDCP